MRPYSQDLRARIIAACEAGQRTGEVAARFAVSDRPVRRYRQMLRERGSLAPLTGRAPRGQRGVGQVPRNWGQATTLLAGLTMQGITAALLVAGATDQPVFETFVTEGLAPTLVPGQLVIWDNLSVPTSPRARRVIAERGGALRLLPPSSPDVNPIEQVFSKLKRYLRRVEARTQDRLWDAIGTGLTQITARDAHGWFRHCGYDLTGQYA